MENFKENDYLKEDKLNTKWKKKLDQHEYEEKMLNQQGFICEDKKFMFNHAIFIQYAMTRINALNCNEHIFFYNYKEERYVQLEEEQYMKIFFYIIEEASLTIWKRKYENEYIPYFLRKLKYSEDNGMKPGVLHFTNGILDIDNNEIYDPTPDIFSLVQLPYEYDEDAEAPRFKKFLSEIFGGDQTRIDLIQEIMGACLYYEDIMQKLIVFLGNGSNVKSLLSNIIKKIVGEKNVSAIALDNLSGGRFSKQNLDRKLLNISSETKTEKLYSTADLKSLTGGDSTEIEEKYAKSYTTEIHSKFILLANDMIQTKDYSDGFYRRLLIIPFEQCFKDRDPNKEDEEGVLYKDIYLEGELENELSGIFNFALGGLYRLMDNDFNFTKSPKCAEALERYKNEHNVVKAFYNNCITIHEPEDKVKARSSDVYIRFLAFCRQNHFNGNISSIMFHRLFKAILAEENAPVMSKHRHDGDVYVNLSLN